MRKILLTLICLGVIEINAQIIDENFDSSDGGWTSSSASGDTHWEWGSPLGTTIADDNDGGGNAWVTGLSGSFTLNDSPELSYVTTSSYDLSSLSTEGSISVAINLDLVGSDWAYVEYSIDNGVNWTKLGASGSGSNWYDDSFDEVWTTTSNTSGAWIIAIQDLPMDALGESSVTFRFVLDSVEPTGAYAAEGLAVDDFQIFDTGTGGGSGGGSGATLPNEDFNASDEGWVGSSDLANIYWEWGMPAGTQINDDNSGGGSAWVTGLSGDFSFEENDVIYLTSQPYDLSSLTTEGSVSIAINYDLGTFNNGSGDEDDFVVMEYTTDGFNWNPLGLSGSGVNWYNDGTINAWTLNSGGWVTAAHDLPFDALGEVAVSFRLIMISGAPTELYGSEGFAMDDFQISDTSVGGGDPGGGPGGGGVNPDTQILTFELSGEVFPAVINDVSSSIKMFVSSSTDVTVLDPTFTLAGGATVDVPSGTSRDFTTSQTYTVTSSDGMSSTDWTVTAEVPRADLTLEPNTGIHGSRVAIYGRGFSTVTAENTVTFGGQAVNLISASANKLVIEVPADANYGLNEILTSTNGVDSKAGTKFNVLATGVTGFYDEYTMTDFNLNTSSPVNSMDMADLDGDGDLDLVYDNETLINIATLENGRILSTVNKISGRTSGNSSFKDLTLIDVDGDGLKDIVAGGSRLGWFKNNGDGTWGDESIIDDTYSVNRIRVFDIDGDIDADILLDDESSVYSFTGDGAGNFVENATTTPFQLGEVIDWDEDGDLDMLSVSGAGNEIVLSTNDGSGNFTDNTLHTTAISNVDFVQYGDLDNDGDLDFIYTTADSGTSVSTVGYILNNGDGTYATAVTIATEGIFNTVNVELGDVNNDGILDIGRTKNDGADGVVQIYVSSDLLTYPTVETLDSNADGLDLIFVDIDQDGDMDLLSEASQSGGYYPLFIRLLQDADIVGFSLSDETGLPTINTTTLTVQTEVGASADIANLSPAVEVSVNADVEPASGVIQDFTNPVAYTVTAEDGTINNWTVTVYQVPSIPVVSSSSVEQTTATISWSEVNAGENYEFELSEVEDFSTLVDGYDPFTINSPSTSTITVDLTSLTPGSTYYARVRAQNVIGSYSGYSTSISFDTKPSNPVLTDVATSNIGQDTISLSWAAVSGVVDSYTIEVSLTENFASLPSDYPVQTTSTQFVIGKDGSTVVLSANTTYWIRITANNTTGSSGYSNVISVLTLPETPVVNVIDNAEVDQTQATVSWSSVFTGGGSYNVEVSSTDFADGGTLLTGYPVTVTGTSAVIGSDPNTEDLQPATNYWVRVRSSNGSGESLNSNVISFLTIPGTPIPLAPTNVTRESFTANWNEVTGADGYLLLVLANDEATVVFTDNTTATSSEVTGLTPGSTYKYSVQAFNATGASPDSNPLVEATTVEANETPTGLSLDAESISENEPIGTLIGNFSTTDANSGDTHTYSFVSGVGDDDNASFSIDGNQLLSNEVFNLELKETYRVRVQTEDQDGATTSQSFDITIINVNEAPTDIILILANATGYDPVGTLVAEIEAADEDSGHSENMMFELIEGGESFKINNQTQTRTLSTDVFFTNEVDSIIPITLRATDPNGATFDESFDITINAFVDREVPEFRTNIANPKNFIVEGADYDSLALKAIVTDFRIKEVRLFTRLLQEAEPVSKVIPMTMIDGLEYYIDSVGVGDLGIAGIEYYFEATDEEGNSQIWSNGDDFSPSVMVLELPQSGENAPKVESVTKFGRTVDSYQIISIPFIFDNDNQSEVRSIFQEYTNGSPDNRTWRIIRFDPELGENGELVNMEATDNIKEGEGYFFIAQEEKQITIDNAKINTDDPFPLVLKQGWNLIGNPFNLDIDFDGVIESNGATGIVQSLKVLDTENPETWPSSQVLRSLEGGFVFSSQDITLNISYTDAFLSFGGRVVDDHAANVDWFLPITLEQNGDIRNGGVGMDRMANTSFDSFDEPVLPRWLEFLEMSFMHEGETFDRLNKDVVPLTDSYIWEFEVTSSGEGISTLNWDASKVDVVNLQLYDLQSGAIIDMTEQTSYDFDLSGTAKFKLLYSSDPDKTFEFEALSLLAAYPNPFTEAFKVPMRLPATGSDYRIQVKLIDLSGKAIHTGSTQNTPGGSFEYLLKRPEGIRPGLYLYEVIIEHQGISKIHTKRIIIK